MSHMPDMPDDRAISLLAIDQYVREVRWTVHLAEEEEAKYLESVARGTAERSKLVPNQWVLSLARDARDRLVERYQPMVLHIARRFSRRFPSCELLDLVQEGNIGLLKAVEDFAPVEGYAFPLYAHLEIHHAIVNALSKQEGPSGVGSTTKSLYWKLRRFTSTFLNENGYHPGVQDIAEGLSLSSAQAADLVEGQKVQRVSSLQQVMTYEDGDGGRECFSSLYASSVKQEDERQTRLRAMLDRAMDALLTDYQREALRLRFGWYEDRPDALTCEEVAQEVEGPCSLQQAYSRVQGGLARLRDGLSIETENHQPVCVMEREEEDYYTVAQVAALLNTQKDAVSCYIKKGLLSARWGYVHGVGVKMLKVSKASVEAFWKDLQRVRAEKEICYNVKQAASVLGMDEHTVSRYVSKGCLPVKRMKEGVNSLVLIPKQAVHAFLAERQASSVA